MTGSRLLVEQRPGLFQIGCVEALCKPAVDWCQYIGGFLALALLEQHSRQCRGRAQFKKAGPPVGEL